MFLIIVLAAREYVKQGRRGSFHWEEAVPVGVFLIIVPVRYLKTLRFS